MTEANDFTDKLVLDYLDACYIDTADQVTFHENGNVSVSDRQTTAHESLVYSLRPLFPTLSVRGYIHFGKSGAGYVRYHATPRLLDLLHRKFVYFIDSIRASLDDEPQMQDVACCVVRPMSTEHRAEILDQLVFKKKLWALDEVLNSPDVE